MGLYAGHTRAGILPGWCAQRRRRRPPCRAPEPERASPPSPPASAHAPPDLGSGAALALEADDKPIPPGVPKDPSCINAPSDATCTGRNPNALGCGQDANTIADPRAAAQIVSLTGAGVPRKLGEVRLRYSRACRSMWSRVVLSAADPSGATTLVASAQSFFDGLLTTTFPPRSASALNSPMIFVGSGRFVSAGGQIDPPGQEFGSASTPFFSEPR